MGDGRSGRRPACRPRHRAPPIGQQVLQACAPRSSAARARFGCGKLPAYRRTARCTVAGVRVAQNLGHLSPSGAPDPHRPGALHPLHCGHVEPLSGAICPFFGHRPWLEGTRRPSTADSVSRDAAALRRRETGVVDALARTPTTAVRDHPARRRSGHVLASWSWGLSEAHRVWSARRSNGADPGRGVRPGSDPAPCARRTRRARSASSDAEVTRRSARAVHWSAQLERDVDWPPETRLARPARTELRWAAAATGADALAGWIVSVRQRAARALATQEFPDDEARATIASVTASPREAGPRPALSDASDRLP